MVINNALFPFLSQICSKPQKQENLNLNVSFVFKLLNILWCFTESAVFASLGFFRHGLGFSVPGNLKWVAHCTVSSENSYAPGSFPQNPNGRALVLNSFIETRSPLNTSSYSGILMNAIFLCKAIFCPSWLYAAACTVFMCPLHEPCCCFPYQIWFSSWFYWKLFRKRAG